MDDTDGQDGGFDLHLHTRHSDGLLTPDEVVERAAAAQLEGLALTDHDGGAGLQEGAECARRLGLRFIPGIEISCRHDGVDLHLLGWFIDATHPPLARALSEMAAARERRLDDMLVALGRAGAPITRDDVRAQTTGAVVGRPHVAEALVVGGHAHDVQNAFDRWLKRGRPGFVPLERMTAVVAMALVRDAGGVTAVAHPGLGVPDAIITALAGEGLAALEADHPGHSNKQRAHYQRFATQQGLAATAGSDYHGRGRNHAAPGSKRTPPATVARLEALRRTRPIG